MASKMVSPPNPESKIPIEIIHLPNHGMYYCLDLESKVLIPLNPLGLFSYQGSHPR